MTGKTIEQLRVGDVAELARRVDSGDVAGFVQAVGDLNPIHSDAEFAASTGFGEPIAPGIFTAGLISAVIGTRLPGPGVIYLSQTLKFVKPVRAGDVITARVEVVELLPGRNRVRLATRCTNQRGEEVLVGEAWVMPSRRAVLYRRPAAATPAAAALALAPLAWTAQALALWSSLGLALLGGRGRQG